MKKYTLIVLLIFSLGIDSIAQISIALNDTLTNSFQRTAALYNLKGISAAVVFSDGSVWETSYGNYGTQPLTGDLLYEIGSSTKTMVAAIILMLEDEGKLSIDDTIYKYVTPIKNVSYGITIKQLLNHTSGLYNFTEHPDFFKYINQNWNTQIPVDDIFSKYLDAPKRAPGGPWEYCNTNFTLLGKIIEKVEGKQFHEVLREKVFTPNNLNESYLAFYENHKGIYPGTWLNGTYNSIPSKSFLTGAWAAGGVISTPRNLAQWAYKLYSGQVLSENSYNKMTSTVPTGGSDYFGLSMFQRTYKGHKYLGHGGQTLQTSTMEYSIDGDYGIVVMGIEDDKYGPTNNLNNLLKTILETEIPKVDLTSTKELTTVDNSYQIYPIPANDFLNIKSENGSNFEAELITLNGQVVNKIVSQNGAVQMENRVNTEGYYLLKITSHSNKISYQRISFQ